MGRTRGRSCVRARTGQNPNGFDSIEVYGAWDVRSRLYSPKSETEKFRDWDTGA